MGRRQRLSNTASTIIPLRLIEFTAGSSFFFFLNEKLKSGGDSAVKFISPSIFIETISSRCEREDKHREDDPSCVPTFVII